MNFYNFWYYQFRKTRPFIFQNSIGDNCYIVVSGALQIVVTDTKKSGIETNTKVALLAPGRPVGHLIF